MMPEPHRSSLPHENLEEFRAHAALVAAQIDGYWQALLASEPTWPVQSAVKPGQIKAAFDGPLPRAGRPFETVLAETVQRIMPGLTHWQSPHFYGFFSANISPPSVLGELLSAGLGVQGMLWATSPACTELEMAVLDQVAIACGLPSQFTFSGSQFGGGSIQGTASEAAVVALVAARNWLRKTGRAERTDQLVVYCSSQAHSSITKAAMVTGIAESPEDRIAVRWISVDAQHRMKTNDLRAEIRKDIEAGRVPCAVVATLGTTSTLGFDDLQEIGHICDEHGLWLHVDAAMAGAACICPEFRWMLAGIEDADSYCFNPHKWLLTNFDCDLMYVADRREITGALSITPEYLKNSASERGEVIDYRDWQVPLGRRFRALKLHFVLQTYGLDGLAAYIREHARLGHLIADWVRADRRFEFLYHNGGLSLVCFKLRDHPGESHAEADKRTKAFVDAINASGRMVMTHSVVPITASDATVATRTIIRWAVGATFTREEHVRADWLWLQSQLPA